MWQWFFYENDHDITENHQIDNKNVHNFIFSLKNSPLVKSQWN